MMNYKNIFKFKLYSLLYNEAAPQPLNKKTTTNTCYKNNNNINVYTTISEVTTIASIVAYSKCLHTITIITKI